MKVKKDSRYAYPLKLDVELKEPLKELAADNRRDINDEINIAVERHLIKNKKKINAKA